MANRWLAPNANAVILPLAALLNGIGYVVIARWNPGPGPGPGRAGPPSACCSTSLTLLVVRYSRDLERYRYLLLLVAGVLLVAPLFFSPIYGARLWVHFGSLSFQPIEFSKILLCIFFASYFAENKEMLSIPTAQIGNRLYPRPPPAASRSWWPGAPPWRSSAWRTTSASPPCCSSSSSACSGWPPGRVGYLVLGLVLFGVGAYIAARYFGQVHLRVERVAEPLADATANPGGYPAAARPGTAWARRRRGHRARASTTTPARSRS